MAIGRMTATSMALSSELWDRRKGSFTALTKVITERWLTWQPSNVKWNERDKGCWGGNFSPLLYISLPRTSIYYIIAQSLSLFFFSKSECSKAGSLQIGLLLRLDFVSKISLQKAERSREWWDFEFFIKLLVPTFIYEQDGSSLRSRLDQSEGEDTRKTMDWNGMTTQTARTWRLWRWFTVHFLQPLILTDER